MLKMLKKLNVKIGFFFFHYYNFTCVVFIMTVPVASCSTELTADAYRDVITRYMNLVTAIIFRVVGHEVNLDDQCWFILNSPGSVTSIRSATKVLIPFACVKGVDQYDESEYSGLSRFFQPSTFQTSRLFIMIIQTISNSFGKRSGESYPDFWNLPIFRNKFRFPYWFENRDS